MATRYRSGEDADQPSRPEPPTPDTANEAADQTDGTDTQDEVTGDDAETSSATGKNGRRSRKKPARDDKKPDHRRTQMTAEERQQRRQQHIQARRRQRTPGPPPDEEPSGPEVPKVTVRIVNGGAGALRTIERHRNGSPRMFRKAVRRNPRTNRREEAPVPDPNGTLHRQKRTIHLHEGTEIELYADEIAGFVWKGFAEYLDGDITEEQLLNDWVPDSLKADEAFV